MPEPVSGPDHRPAGELVPQAVRRLVVHQLVGAIDEARGAEHERLVVAGHAGIVEDPGAAQRAVRERHRHAADHVVEHLVPVQDAQRVGARIALDLDPEHQLVVVR